eukprot:TRINITY_DN15771_c0_g1_i7.p1 TRINITY_DN15771_c0_g1~~TRINITY_DN15771_c0_g1_i7.p1  ORF type:complete len:467 (-),score=98.28 TRINITY_DN15771_c0_g1_i7:66-1466(-)
MGFISFSFSPNVTFVVQVSVRRYQSLIMCLVCLVGFEWAPHWWSRVSSFGSSGINAEYGVYFDNDNCEQYHSRVNREEGATLIRIRWYGNYGRSLFIEQKTHHEKWVEQLSIKERFQMDTEHIKGWLKGTKTYKDFIPKLRTKGMSDEQIASNWALANEIQHNILQHQLHPVIRTVYNRTAFQLTSTNIVRISLDTNLQFIKEMPKSPNDPQWVHLGTFPSQSVLTFPLGVLEIKLHDVPPSWVMDLVKSGYLIRAERFSKFQHSMAIFYPKSISLRPHWFGNPIVNINASGSHTWYTVGTLTHAQTHKPLHLLESNENPEEEKKFGITTLLKDTLVSFPILPIEPQQKLDPNFFLANERVLLKWIRISLTWSSLGIFFVFSGATKLAEYVSGWGLLLLAISTAGYGIASHQLRLKAWKSKSHYSDPVGITIVLSAIFLAALFVAVLAGVYGEPIRFRRLALLTPK